jgi:UDP-N-acetylglucosamine--N-acetylmuramyl-(pentapeptide) pyrophosphoryl-undecaprenol N-acetylglucosamine transferase
MQMQSPHNRHNIKVIVSGGGTGGHIFPAIAIANALKAKVPDIEILFIGAKDKMEMEKVPAAGYPIVGLWISGLQRKLTLKNLSFPLKVLSSLYKAKRIIKNFNPDAVVGVGGFASGPVLRIAVKKRIPSVIQEQNSFPGITNRLLAGKVNKICVAFEGMEKYFPKNKIIITGNPVRKEVIEIRNKKEEAVKYFGLVPSKKTILVIGGSQGALAINKGIEAGLNRFAENNVQVVWQTGKFYVEAAMNAVKEIKSDGIKVTTFIDRMDYAYALADIVVSRAGAIAISEICAVGKPVILVPLPTAAEDHQTKNAISLVEKNAAILVKDHETQSVLAIKAIELLNDKHWQEEMKQNLLKLSHTDSADKIADEILTLIKN